MDQKTKKLFASCFFIYFANGIMVLSLGSLLPLITGEISMSYQLAGIALSAQATGNLLSSFFVGVLANKFGQKKAVLLLSPIGVLAFVLLSIASRPWLCIVAFFCAGVGRAGGTYITNTIVNNHSAGKAGPLNVLHAFFAVGAFMSPLLIALCFSHGLSFRLIAVLIGLLPAITIVLFASMELDGEMAGTNVPSNDRVVSDFLRDPNFLISVSVVFLYLGIETGVNGWLVTYLQDSNIVPPVFAQYMLSVLWILILAGRLLSARLSHQVKRNHLLLIMSGGILAFVSLFSISKNPIVSLIAISGIGLSMAGVYPTAMSNAGPLIAGSAVGMSTILTLSSIGGIVMPYISGVISDTVGIQGGMVFMGVVALFLFLIALMNFWMKRR